MTTRRKPGRPSLGPAVEVRGRLEQDIYDAAVDLANLRGVSLAALMRRAVKRELALAEDELAAGRAAQIYLKDRAS